MIDDCATVTIHAPQVAHATRGFIKSPTAHLSSFAPSGPGLAVVDTLGLGWRNGPLPSMRFEDDDDDDDG